MEILVYAQVLFSVAVDVFSPSLCLTVLMLCYGFRQVRTQLANPIPLTGATEGLQPFIIRKQLQKDPEDYADGESQPHVRVAKRLRLLGRRDGVMKVGGIVCRLDTRRDSRRHCMEASRALQCSLVAGETISDWNPSKPCPAPHI